MAGAKDIQAGRATVTVGIKDTVSKGLERISARLKAFGQITSAIGSGVTAVSAGMASALSAATLQFASVGSAIEDMANRTGLSTEAVSELGYAADQSGTDLGALETGIKKMQNTLADAEQGSKQATAALSRLGLTTKELAGLSPDKQFELIADRIGAITDPAQRTAAAMDIFGKAGTQLIPMMADGAAGIRAMREECAGLALTMDKETAAKAGKLDDMFAKLRGAARGVTTQIGAAMSDAVLRASEVLLEAMASVSNFIKENQHLVTTVAGVTLGLAALGTGLVGVGIAAGVASFALSGLAAIGGIVSGVFAALFSPVGIALAAIVAAVGLATVAFWKLADPFKALSPVVNIVLNSLKLISKALASGDYRLAAEAAMTGIKAVFFSGIKAVLDMWKTGMSRLSALITGGESGITGAVKGVLGRVQSLFASVWPTIQLGMTALISFAKDSLNQLPELATYAAGRMVRAIYDALNKLQEAIAKLAISLVEGLLSAFKSLGPKLAKAMLTGNVAGIADEFSSILTKELQAKALIASSVISGFVKNEAPTFEISGETKSALAAVSAEADRLGNAISSRLAELGAGGEGDKKDESGGDGKVVRAKPDIDSTPLEKYRERVVELATALKAGDITAEKFAAGIAELKRETVGVDGTPLDQFRARVALLGAALSDGVINQREYVSEVAKAQETILGLESSATALESFGKRVGDLSQQYRAGAITAKQYSDATMTAQSEFLGLDPSPIETYTARIKELQQALAKGLITRAQFDAAALKAIPDDVKQVFDETRTPIEKFRTDMAKLQDMRALLGEDAFARKSDLLGKQLLEDSGVDVDLLTGKDKKKGGGFSSDGTFSAAAAAGMGVGGVNTGNEMVEEQKKAREVLEQINEGVKGRFKLK